MTPAEEIAATKPPYKPPTEPGRKAILGMWECKVREVRKRLRLTQTDVQKALGLSQGRLSCIENGQEPTLDTARKLAAFFGKTVEELWPRRISEDTTQP